MDMLFHYFNNEINVYSIVISRAIIFYLHKKYQYIYFLWLFSSHLVGYYFP